MGVPIIRIIVFWGLYWGPLILGNYHIELRTHYLGVSWQLFDALGSWAHGGSSYEEFWFGLQGLGSGGINTLGNGGFVGVILWATEVPGIPTETC